MESDGPGTQRLKRRGGSLPPHCVVKAEVLMWSRYKPREMVAGCFTRPRVLTDSGWREVTWKNETPQATRQGRDAWLGVKDLTKPEEASPTPNIPQIDHYGGVPRSRFCCCRGVIYLRTSYCGQRTVAFQGGTEWSWGCLSVPCYLR